MNLSRARPGFLLLEAILGIAVFAIFALSISLSLLYGQEGTVDSGDRTRAVALTQRALEGARSIRDASFSGLAAGTHGVWIHPATGMWAFTGSAIAHSGSYVTAVTVTPLASGIARLTAETRWKHGYNRSGSVLIVTELTDWRAPGEVGNWGGLTLEGSYTDAGTPLFGALAIADTVLFAASETSDGGKGLYVFDVSVLSAPVRLAAGFDLAFKGYDLVVHGTRLYALTADPGAELKVYDIADPAAFGADKLVVSADLPGSGRGRSLALRGSVLFVGMAESAAAGEDELLTYDIGGTGALVVLGSADAEADILSIAISGTSALLATSNNGLELIAARADAPAAPLLLPSQAYNATDVQDGIAVAVTGTSAVLGRMNGEAIEELLLFDTGGQGFDPPPPGPWFHEAGGSVRDLALDPTGCYAFAATDFENKELQIVKIRDTLLPERAYYDAASGAGRGIAYDALRDRLFLATNTAIHIFKPGSGSSCL